MVFQPVSNKRWKAQGVQDLTPEPGRVVRAEAATRLESWRVCQVAPAQLDATNV